MSRTDQPISDTTTPTTGRPTDGQPPSDRPILIVGCPRSGTTLLQLMLHAHPDIAIPPENRFVLEVYDERAEFGDLDDPANRRALAEFIVERRRSKLRDFGLSAEQMRQRIVDAPPTIGSAVETVLRSYATRFGARRWGDKRPLYIQRLGVVMRMFPDAQVIHIIRDGRDCVSSLKRMPWWKGNAIVSTWTWRAAIAKGRRAAKKLGDAYVEVRYEDLVAAPEAQLRRICDFLGEQFHDSMLEPHRVADVAVPDRKVWHTRTFQAVDDAAVQRWRSDLEPWELDLFEFVAARQLRRYGYALSRGRRPLPPLVPLLRFVKLDVLRTWGRWRNAVRDARLQRGYGASVAAQPVAAATDDARSAS